MQRSGGGAVLGEINVNSRRPLDPGRYPHIKMQGRRIRSQFSSKRTIGMNEEYVSEMYILYLIDAMDNVTEKEFMAKLLELNAPYKSVDEFMRAYETEESIYVDLIQWVKDEWANAKEKNPAINAREFAKARVPDFLSSLS